ncbi:MAG: FUSC family protein [Pseudomonadota bacterium]
MKATAGAAARSGWFAATLPDWRHGVQLAAAVALSWLASAALHLPEGFWAVMSALIVVRPTAGSTLGAGWDRVRGTFAGTALGLAGAWLAHHGAGSSTALLGMVTLVAFASAVVPGMRSAPISALIVLTSSGIPGHSAFDVALMRVLEIAIGVAVGLGVSLAGLAAQARHRLQPACAAVLRQIAAQCRQELGGSDPAPASHEAARTQLRTALRELTILAMAADREEQLIARWHRIRGAAPALPADKLYGLHLRRVRLLTRIAHDAGSFARLAEVFADKAPLDAWAALGQRVGTALDTAAAGLETQSPASFDGLRSYLRAEDAAAPDLPVRTFALPAARLLIQDLSRLVTIRPA